MHLCRNVRHLVQIAFTLLGLALLIGLASPVHAVQQTNVKLNQALEANKPVLDFRVSPTGSRIAYRVARTLPPDQDSPPPPFADLYSVPASGGAAVKLNPAAVTANESVESYQFSPDGSQIIYLRTTTDTVLGNVFELFRVPADGSAAPVTVSGPIPVGNRSPRDFNFNFQQNNIIPVFGDGSVRSVNFSVHERSVPERITSIRDGSSNTFFFGEQVNNLLQTPGDGSVRQINPGLVSGGVVYDFQITPDGTRAIYRADQNLDGAIELFSVPADGSDVGFRISGPMVAGGDVKEFQISADSSRAVYLADQSSDGVVELYSARTNGGIVTKLNGPLTSGGNVTQFQVSTDGNSVFYLADQNLDGVFQLFGVATTGSTPALVSAPLTNSGNVRSFLLSPDGSRLIFVDNSGPVFSLRLNLRNATVGQSPIVTPGGPPVANLPVPDVQVSADGNHLVYLADNGNDGKYELASVVLTPTLTVVPQLNAPLVAGGNIRAFKISPDGQRVLYVADQNTPGVFELFSVAISGGTVEKVNGTLIAGGSVKSGLFDFQFSPDSRSIYYLADQEIAGLTELFTAYDAPAVEFTQSGYVIAEDGTLTPQLALRRNGILMAPSSVRVQLTGLPDGGTAKGGASLGGGGVDFVNNVRDVDFATGEISKTFSVPIKNDGIAEPAETFSMQAFEPAQSVLGAQENAQVFILDTATSPLLQNENLTLPENSTNGSQVPVTAAEVAATVVTTYTILSGNTNNAFRIDNSGNLFVNNSAALNYEVTPLFTLLVEARADNGSSAAATWKIALQDQNEPPIFVPQTRTIAENSAVNTFVGPKLVAVDPDGDVVTFTAKSNFFNLTPSGQLLVKDSSKLDFETQPVLTVGVTVNDGKGHSVIAVITVNVLDVAEGDPNAPTIAKTNPASTVAGGKEFTLIVTGQNLTANSVVRWNGSARKTVLVKDALYATITAQDIAVATTAKVDVIDSSTKKASLVVPFPVTKLTVGIAAFSASTGSGQQSAVGLVTTFNLEWTHTDSQPWRTMDEMDVRLVDGDSIPLWVRYQQTTDEDGNDSDTIILLNADGTPAGSGHFGDLKVLENETVRLDLAHAILKGSGDTGSHILVILPVTFKIAAVQARPYTIEMFGVDDLGAKQGPNVMGSWTITKPSTYLPQMENGK